MTELCIYRTTNTVLQNDLIIVVFAKLSRQNKEWEEHMVVNIKDIIIITYYLQILFPYQSSSQPPPSA